MSARYNDSETVDVNIFMTDRSNDSTLQWSYSATGTDADPVSMPISSLLGASSDGFLEHRFEWTPDTLIYGNNNTNLSASNLVVNRDDSHTIPSVAVPISFSHWSDGDPTASEGPPLIRSKLARIGYTRFFFNSTLASRQEEFESQCAAAAASVTCSTDDNTLRDSTAFDLAATAAFEPVKQTRSAPTYSLIAMTVSGGLLAILLAHGMVNLLVRRTSTRKHMAVPTSEDSGDASSHDSYDMAQAQHGVGGGGTSTPPLPPAYPITSNSSPSSSSQSSTMEKKIAPRRQDSDSSRDDDQDDTRDVEKGSTGLSTAVLSKWDPAALARAQLDDDSDDDSDDEEQRRRRRHDGDEGDDASLADSADDDDLMEDAQQEMNITNDDGLGRPDHLPFNSHPHSVPDDMYGSMRADGGGGYPSGYMTPSRMSQPSLLLQQGGGSDSGSEYLHSSSAAYYLNSLPTNASSLSGHHQQPWSGYNGRRMSGHSALAELNQKLSANGAKTGGPDDMVEVLNGDGGGGGTGTTTPANMGYPGYYTQNYASLAASRRSSFGADEYMKPSNMSAFGKRPSIASLHSIAMLNASGGGGNTVPDAYHPTISVWTRLDGKKSGSNEESAKKDQGDALAARVDRSGQPITDAYNSPDKRRKSWWRRGLAYLFLNEGGATLTASGAARVSYLEGLRGFACFLVSLNHFMLMFWYATTTPRAPTHTAHFEIWFYRIFTPLLMNQGTKIGIFFVLPARVMGTRYMLRGKLQDVADSTLRRIPRLAFPTFGAVLINYFCIQVDAYKWVRRLPSRTWSTWAYYQDYDSIGSFINAWIGLWFTLPPQNPVLLSTYATGVLWTIPVITQSSFAILITVIVSREMPNAWKRYSFYFACMLLSWYANRFDYYFIGGLVLADMDNKLHYRQAAAKGIPLVPRYLQSKLPKRILNNGRVHGQVVGWVLLFGGTLVQYLEYLNAPGRDFNNWEHGILPDLGTSLPRVWEGQSSENYNDPRISLYAMVIGIFLLCDLSQAFAGFFMLRWWSAIGRNAFSLYLLHGIIFWTWGAWLCLALLDIGTPYSVAVTIVFFTSYALLALFCELFTRTFDAWGVSMSKALWRYTSAGLGRRD